MCLLRKQQFKVYQDLVQCLLVMKLTCLFHFASICTPINSSHEMFFRPEAKLGTHKFPQCWNIKLTKRILGECVCENIPFGHALLGCDTTSRVFGIGKGVALKKLRNNEYFYDTIELHKCFR